MDIGLIAVVAVVALGIGIALDRFFLKRIGRNRLSQAHEQAERLLADAELEIKTLRHERIEKVEAQLAQREQSFTEETANTIAGTPQQRLVQPEEIAATVAFLCRDEALGITMEDIQVNAGAWW